MGSNSTVTHRGYIGQIEVDAAANMLFGRVINIKDVVVFQGASVPEATQSFKDAVDDYLAYCKENGIQADKPFSGHIPFRTSPECHRNIYIAAQIAGKSVNAWMNDVVTIAAQDVISAAKGKVTPSVKQMPIASGQSR